MHLLDSILVSKEGKSSNNNNKAYISGQGNNNKGKYVSIAFEVK